MIARRSASRLFLIFIILFILFGFFIFASASLGLIGRSGPRFGNVASKQLLILLFGVVVMIGLSRVHYSHWRWLAFPFFTLALLCSILVFVPGLGITAGGANRWIRFGDFTFQPAEFLKFSFIIYLAALLAKPRKNAGTELLPFFVLLCVVAAILIKQPDIDTLLIIALTGIAMLFLSGCRLKYLFIISVIGIVGVVSLVFYKPYVASRVKTFFNPTADLQGSGYQINQSLIAIGSGGWFGRGFGQSVQKYKFLPEPIGDSIFAVAGEEFGFLGAISIILAFLFFALWGLRLAARAPDPFARLLVAGIVIMTMSGAFANIASMLGLMPLAGTTLPFISQGGTSLLFALAEVGLLLNVSRQRPNLKS